MGGVLQFAFQPPFAEVKQVPGVTGCYNFLVVFFETIFWRIQRGNGSEGNSFDLEV